MASPQELVGTTVSESYFVNELAEAGTTRTHDEADLERALWFLYQQWIPEGFRPRTFYRRFTPRTKQYQGGIIAVQAILREEGASGFEFLKHRGKRQLSLESLVVRDAWAHLFNDSDKQIAQQRLDGIAK